jgi:hypothetical protein
MVFFEKTNLISNFSAGEVCCVYIAGIGRIADLDTIVLARYVYTASCVQVRIFN